MSTQYMYVGRCLHLGIPRVWAFTKEECEQAMEQWTEKQVRFKPIALWKFPVITTDDYIEADFSDNFSKGVQVM